MKLIAKAALAAAALGISANASAWYYGAPGYAPVYGPAANLTEEQRDALAEQHEAFAEQQRAAFEQQAEAHRKLVEAQRALWEQQVRMDADLFPVNPWLEHANLMQDMVKTERELLDEMRTRRQESKARFQAAREEARKRRAERLSERL